MRILTKKLFSRKKRRDLIQVEEGLILLLRFTAFDIESHSTCEYDHLTIMDGDGTTLMEKSCGSSLPAAITSRTNSVTLIFTTDDSYAKTGWSVNWTAVTPGLEALFEISTFECTTIFLADSIRVNTLLCL